RPGHPRCFRVCFPLLRLGFDLPNDAKVNYDPVSYRIKLTGDRDINLRYKAVLSLSALGPKAAPAVPTLIQLLSDPDKQLRALAASALANIGVETASHLTKVLQSANAEARASAAALLAKYRGEDTAVAPALVEALNDDSKDVRIRVIVALGTLGPRA